MWMAVAGIGMSRLSPLPSGSFFNLLVFLLTFPITTHSNHPFRISVFLDTGVVSDSA